VRSEQDAQTYQERNNRRVDNARHARASPWQRRRRGAPSGDVSRVGEGRDRDPDRDQRRNEPDRLVEVTSSAAQEVVVLGGGREREMTVPALGSTGSFVTVELRGLTRPLRPGEYVDLTFRFERNGTEQVLAR
jgi:hypothetical protein